MNRPHPSAINPVNAHPPVPVVAPAPQGVQGAPKGVPVPMKVRKVGDRLLPATIQEMVPESNAYKDLLSVERQIDQTISSKRLEIQETLKRPPKVKRRLRVFITTHYQAGKKTTNESSSGAVTSQATGSWELRVEGRLLDQGKDLFKQKRKFSTFFKSLVIELDKERYGPNQHLVEWHRDKQSNETDGFQVKREGDRDVKCTMLFMMNHDPPQCKLDARLARLLAIHTGTRAQILYGLWTYIRTHKLQDSLERDFINLDPYLQQVFQCRRMRFNEIPQRITPLMHPPDPIIIHHRIRCDPTEPKRQAMYDLDVEIDDNCKHMMREFIQTTGEDEEITKLDNQIYEIVDQLNQCRLKHEFFDDFGANPQSFIDKWLASQSRDLKTMKGVGGIGAAAGGGIDRTDDERSAEFYQQPWIQDAVSRFFYNALNERRLELEQVLYQRR